MIFYVFKKRNSFFTWMMLLASVVVSQSLEDSDQEKNVENLDDLIAQATFGDKIEDRVSHQVLDKSTLSSIRSSLPPGVLIRPGTSMGMNSIKFGNSSLEDTKSPMGLPFDPKLLGKLKNFLPGVNNVEQIQDQLDGMLFGGNGEKFTSEKFTREKFTPSDVPDLQKTESQVQNTKVSPITQTVIDGDRANYEYYDYNDYDVYAYDEEKDEKLKENFQLRQELQEILNKLNVSTSTEAPAALPNAEPQRQLRRPIRRRRPQRKRPYVADSGEMNFGYANRRVSSIDEGNIYRGPKVNQIPGRIQTLPYDVRADQLDLATRRIGFPRRPNSQRTGGVDCDFYTDNLCLEVSNYPAKKIVALLNVNRRVGADLIADVVDQSADNLIDGVTAAQENQYTFSHYYGNSIRREDDNHAHRDFAQDGGFLCPSEIKYAKPKRGKTAQGVWKDIVNVNDYTQTLRMEKCLKPGGSCSYVSHHYKSQCSQVYNYHRLLSWDESRGLHMDIYKVPSCCSCHIMGYSYVYPPLSKSTNSKIDLVEPLPTSPPVNIPPKVSGDTSFLPSLNPQKEFQSFLDNIGNKFSFSSRRQPLPGPGPNNSGDLSTRPSNNNVNLLRKRPGQNPRLRRPGNKLPRRRVDPGTQTQRKYLADLLDMDILGTENRETAITLLNEDQAAHRYEDIPIAASEKGKTTKNLKNMATASKLESKSLDNDAGIVIENTEKTLENSNNEKDSSVNYGYHPIIDFFGNFRFDTA